MIQVIHVNEEERTSPEKLCQNKDILWEAILCTGCCISIQAYDEAGETA